MSTQLIRRQERRPPPPAPRGELLLESPPEIPETQSGGFQAVLMYLPMAVMPVMMGLMFLGGGTRNPLMMISSGGMALAMGAMMVGQMGRGSGERKFKLNGARRDYFRYLGQARRRVRRAADQQRESLEWNSPHPESLWSLVMSARIWERRPHDGDFGNVRIGAGPQKLAVELVPPETKPIEDLEPMTAGALRRFIRAHSTVPNLPVAVSLPSFARIIPRGEPEPVRAMVRAMIAQMAAFHSPDDLRVSVCASAEAMPHWDWVKWLPHAMHPTETDAAGPVRLMSTTLTGIEVVLGGELKDRARFSPGLGGNDLPYHIVIVDGGAVTADSQIGADGIKNVCVIDLTGSVAPTADNTMLRLRVAETRMAMLRRDRTGKDVATGLGRPDQLGIIQAEGLARQLAPLRASAAVGGAEHDVLSSATTLTSLLGVDEPDRLDVSEVWRPRAPRNRLRVPIGVDGEGRPVDLDIKEAAQGGFGPHGLCIGATGSGKSELLRTLVLGLAMTHSSEVLNFVLVDFKGGATFLGMDGLQHVSAIITNLEDELPLVDRMYDALHGEMVRRQEWLRQAGNYASLRDYEKAREQGAPLQPMPTLFVVLDEFSELLSAKPDFIELFVMIGRLGRSLGVHLLLASQRLEEGKLRGLDTHLSYRIGLRTFSAMESRVVLGVPDAYELPQAPGNGYLKVGTETMTRFRAAYVSGAHKPQQTRVEAGGPRRIPQIVQFGPAYVQPQIERAPEEPEQEQESSGPEESLFDLVVRRLADQGPPAHPIWLPPLDDPTSLDQMLPRLAETPEHGFTTAGWDGRGKLFAAAGIVDRPFDQRRDPMWLDLSGAAGHLAVAGAPQSGKSTVLRTLITSLALMHTPQEVQFYCLDFGGGTMATLNDLPHVGGVASRLDPDRVRRTVAEVTNLLEERERFFTERGIDSIATYRRMRASGEISGDGFGDVFLVVDNWLTVRQEFEQVETAITDVAARGLGYGIHVMAATNKWSEFRTTIRDLFATRLELRLGDAYESEMDRKLAANVPEGRPGRGLTREGLHFMSALPRIDGQVHAEDLVAGVRQLVETVKNAWGDRPGAPKVRMLPELLPAAQLPQVADTGRRVPIGIDEEQLAPVLLDFDNDPHFIVIGDNECGKSNLLRLIVESVKARYSLTEARLMILDYRRSLLDSAESEHVIGYAASSTAAASLMSDTREALANRLPPSDLTPEQLRNRSWWNGPELFLVVDDYELVATPSGNPMAALAELIPQARDIGMHLIVSRAMGGAGRALFDPVLQRLKDMATPALIMSGTKDEGALFGDVRPQPLPQGRGTHVDRRTGKRLTQTAALTPEE
ncbi:type VII secretion protein EccCa [Thermomonospora umbrina]|uniref:S-DNA-T family DNA segregation ATPase FtsK/SpoIIIE n=1 Tax=Thermomonospora umbrina TaxID=111806 RepID=A0A3D9SUC2_9ACTN|nr:type VII secretion protein EccCa [Thermomonospora umbrina]REE96585.1 S-DNA-T family DNA segregation ATPase FtsK/SpoIIIE [Thermomonospora umbrina]